MSADPSSKPAPQSAQPNSTSSAKPDPALSAKIDKWSQLVAKNPDNELARYSLGSALMEAHDFAAAEPHFARALALRADWVMAYILRAKCLLQLKRMVEAKELLATGRRHSIEQHHDAPVEEIDALLEMLP